MEIKLHLKKSTPGTHVYGGKEDETPIPALYIKREAFPDGKATETITVIIPE